MIKMEKSFPIGNEIEDDDDMLFDDLFKNYDNMMDESLDVLQI